MGSFTRNINIILTHKNSLIAKQTKWCWPRLWTTASSSPATLTTLLQLYNFQLPPGCSLFLRLSLFLFVCRDAALSSLQWTFTHFTNACGVCTLYVVHKGARSAGTTRKSDDEQFTESLGEKCCGSVCFSLQLMKVAFLIDVIIENTTAMEQRRRSPKKFIRNRCPTTQKHIHNDNDEDDDEKFSPAFLVPFIVGRSCH